MRRLLSLILAFALLLGAAPAPAAAARGIGLGFGLGFGFVDVPDDDWAWPYVVEMHAKGLMKGVGDGRFQPNAALTRAEAVTVAVRLMGLEDEAQELSESRIRALLPFSDRDDIPSWTRPYIAVAVDNEIMPVAEDGLLRASEKASRLWVSVLLVRALGYEAEAQAKMTEDLPFKDGDLVPASLVGYVAAAVDHELVQGFPDGTFRPNDPLTRAQAAALLSRTDRQLGEQGRFRPGYLAGDLVRASERDLTITLTVQGKNRTLDVSPDAPVFLDERRADLDDLPKGARVSVVLDDDEQVLMVIAHSPVNLPGVSDVSGEISAIFLPSDMVGGLGLVVLKRSNGKEQTYPLAPQVTATYDGRSIKLDQLRVGDKVQLDVVAGVVIAIKVTERGSGSGRENEIRGTIVNVKTDGLSFLGTIDLKVGNKTQTVTVAPGAVITREGNKVALTELEKGDEVTVRLAGGIAIRITVDKPARTEETLRGEILSIQPATKTTQARLRIRTESGRTRTVTLAKNAVIREGNKKLSVADLREGDEVEVRLVNGVGEEVRVLYRGPLVEEVSGTIEQITAATRTSGPKVTLNTGKATRTVTLASDVSIRYGSTRLQVKDLRIGDKVTITVVDGIGTEMTVTSRGPVVEEIRGTLEKVEAATNTRPDRLTVKTDGGTKRISLAENVSIRYGNTRIKLEDLRPGDELVIVTKDGIGTEIRVEVRAPLVEEVRGTLEKVEAATPARPARLTVKTDGGTKRISLSENVSIYYGDTPLRLEELRVGDVVVIVTEDGIGTEVLVEDRKPLVETVKGTIEQILAVSIRFTSSIVVNTGRESRTIDLAGDVAIRYGRQQLEVGDLRVGDKVTVTLKDGLATEIVVTERGPETEDVKGTLVGIYPFSTTFQSSIDVRTDAGIRNIPLASNVTIRRGERHIRLDDLLEGDQVTVTVVNGLAKVIVAQEVQSEVVSGQLLAVYQVSIDFQPSLALYTAGGERRILLTSETVYVLNGRLMDLDDLQVGDKLLVRLVGGVANRILVEERPSATELTGTLQAIDGRVITVRVSNREQRTLILSDEAKLTLNGNAIRRDELRTGDRVELTARGDVVIELNVQRRNQNNR